MRVNELDFGPFTAGALLISFRFPKANLRGESALSLFCGKVVIRYLPVVSPINSIISRAVCPLVKGKKSPPSTNWRPGLLLSLSSLGL